MLADPIAVAARSPTPAINFAVAKLEGRGSERVDTNLGGYALTINHQPSKSSNRHYVRVSLSKDAVDPYTSRTQRVSASVSVAIATSTFGFTSTDLSALWALLKDTVDHANVGVPRLLADQS